MFRMQYIIKAWNYLINMYIMPCILYKWISLLKSDHCGTNVCNYLQFYILYEHANLWKYPWNELALGEGHIDIYKSNLIIYTLSNEGTFSIMRIAFNKINNGNLKWINVIIAISTNLVSGRDGLEARSLALLLLTTAACKLQLETIKIK